MISNKDDTGEIIKVAGELQQKIDKLNEEVSLNEKRLTACHTFTNISIPAMMASGIAVATGCALIVNGAISGNNTEITTGTISLGIGALSFVGFEIVFNIGASVKLKAW